MQKPETSPQTNTASELSPESSKRTTRGGKTLKIIKAHVNDALTGYLRSMSLIDDDEEVYSKTDILVKIGKSE